MLIAAAMPIVSIYRLSLGHAVWLNWTCARHQPLQGVVSFASSLPEPPSELDVIVVRKKGAKQSHRDFCVGRSAVHRTQ